MDPQIKSLLTSFAMTIATGVAGAAAAHGYIHAADQSAVSDAIVTALSAGVTTLLAWYKTRQVTPKAAIQQVNSQDNGVKVVSAMAFPNAPPVNEPQKGTVK